MPVVVRNVEECAALSKLTHECCVNEALPIALPAVRHPLVSCLSVAGRRLDSKRRATFVCLQAKHDQANPDRWECPVRHARDTTLKLASATLQNLVSVRQPTVWHSGAAAMPSVPSPNTTTTPSWLTAEPCATISEDVREFAWVYHQHREFPPRSPARLPQPPHPTSADPTAS